MFLPTVITVTVIMLHYCHRALQYMRSVGVLISSIVVGILANVGRVGDTYKWRHFIRDTPHYIQEYPHSHLILHGYPAKCTKYFRFRPLRVEINLQTFPTSTTPCGRKRKKKKETNKQKKTKLNKRKQQQRQHYCNSGLKFRLLRTKSSDLELINLHTNCATVNTTNCTPPKHITPKSTFQR